MPSPRSILSSLLLVLLVASGAAQTSLDALPAFTGPIVEPVRDDWLVKPVDRKAAVYRSVDGRDLVMDNGLIRRVWRMGPGVACYRFGDLRTGKSLLRAVRPEARVTIDGIEREVGGLEGQPNHAFLLPEWLDEMRSIPGAMKLWRFEVKDELEPRMDWARVRRHAPDAVWPPRGVHLRMDFVLNAAEPSRDTVSRTFRRLYASDMTTRDEGWTLHESASHPRSSFENEGKFGEIYTPHHSAVFAERALPSGVTGIEATVSLGTDRSASWGPGIGLVWRDGETERPIKFTLRTGDSQFGFSDGRSERYVPGRRDSARYRLRMMLGETEVTCFARAAGRPWEEIGRIARPEGLGEPVALRVGKMDIHAGRADHSSAHAEAELGRCKIDEVIVFGAPDQELLGTEVARSQQVADPIVVSVHYEMYDGIPVMSKWLTVRNETGSPVTVDRFTAEVLAVVEEASWVSSPDPASSASGTAPVVYPTPRALQVITDFSFGDGGSSELSNRHVVHWRTDPLFTSQVNYRRMTPCLLEVQPDVGPGQRLESGATFESCRVFELVHDATDRERRGLANRRMYRVLAPWTTENPLTHHLQDSRPEEVRRAIDQAVEVGFEMVIMSFGSGFNIEDESPANLKRWKELGDYAKARGIELGGYSLLASRRVGGGHDVVSPPGQRPQFGNSPCLCSAWGRDYFRKLYQFFEQTGLVMFEHDGNYPGDVCASTEHPDHRGLADSQWNQWRRITDFYRHCRAQGIYVNVPERYFLNGGNKCGLGYREVNWSLPRAHQVIHTRQNIYDGTWDRSQTMGWMFVPLVQYQGGGAAATVEPLDEHLDHYERMLSSNFGLGVQAHYRGPRLFDTPRTRERVRFWVDWYKRYRDILDSDLIHGRRADGQDIDWMLHVNPQLDEKGMLVVYNPLKRDVTRTIDVNLYYTGLTVKARFSREDQQELTLAVPRNDTVRLPVTVPAEGMTWYVIR